MLRFWTNSPNFWHHKIGGEKNPWLQIPTLLVYVTWTNPTFWHLCDVEFHLCKTKNILWSWTLGFTICLGCFALLKVDVNLYNLTFICYMFKGILNKSKSNEKTILRSYKKDATHGKLTPSPSIIFFFK